MDIRPTTLDDIPALLALTNASDLAFVGEPDTTAEEIREILTGPHTGSWLASDPTGDVVGWGSLENDSATDQERLGVYAWPGRGEPVMRPLIDLLLAEVRRRAREFGHEQVTVRTGILHVEKDLAAALREAGFRFRRRHARMRIALRGDEVAPTPPDGVTLDEVRPEDLRTCYELEVGAMADTDHPEHLDFAGWQAWLSGMAGVPWDEWRLARVDGVPAGVLISTNQQLGQDEGWVSRLAVARAYRGRGLGRLLLRTAFAVYAAKGRASAGLGVDMTNPTGAYGLYRSVGMAPVYEADVYELGVRP